MRVAKFVVGLSLVAGLVGIPSAALANHRCDAIEVQYFCPWTGTMASACIGDPHGESHPCLNPND